MPLLLESLSLYKTFINLKFKFHIEIRLINSCCHEINIFAMGNLILKENEKNLSDLEHLFVPIGAFICFLTLVLYDTFFYYYAFRLILYDIFAFK